MQVKVSEFVLLEHDMLMDLVFKVLDNMVFCCFVAGLLWRGN